MTPTRSRPPTPPARRCSSPGSATSATEALGRGHARPAGTVVGGRDRVASLRRQPGPTTQGEVVSTLVAIPFPGADTAAQALGTIRSLEHEGGIKLEDTAVVTKAADGKINVKNEASSGTETGVAVGAVLGSLLFVVFPIAGLVGGAVAGGLIGRSVAPGIDG